MFHPAGLQVQSKKNLTESYISGDKCVAAICNKRTGCISFKDLQEFFENCIAQWNKIHARPDLPETGHGI